MSEATAATLAARITGEEAPANTEPIVDEEESQVEEELDSTEDTEESETEEEESTELPDNIKEILAKNRKEVREANARAVAAEKALAASKESKESKEDAPESETDSKFKELYLKSAAKTALVEAGITTGTDRFLKMLDLSSVDVDDSGAISGLEDQIAGLKEDFADVLAPKPARKSVGNTDGARKPAPTVPKSSAELLASRLIG